MLGGGNCSRSYPRTSRPPICSAASPCPLPLSTGTCPWEGCGGRGQALPGAACLRLSHSTFWGTKLLDEAVRRRKPAAGSCEAACRGWGGGFAYSQIHARGGRVTWGWPWDAHVPVPGGFVPLPCASWGLRALLGQWWGGPGESAAPCHQGSKRTRRGVPGGSWGAAIGARGVRCAAPAWHGGSSSLQLPALCCSKAHFVQPPARH